MDRRTQMVYRALDSFFRHRWQFLAALAAVTGAAAAAVLLRAGTYEATARIQVVTENVAATARDEDRRNDGRRVTPARQNVDRFRDLIDDDLRGGFLDAALRKAKLTPPLQVDPKAGDARFAALRERLDAEPVSDTTFAIRLAWNKPDECERIVNALRDQYLVEVGLNRQARSVATAKFLDRATAGYEQRMREAERALVKFRTAGDLPGAQGAMVSRLGVLRAQLDSLTLASQDNALRRSALEQRIAEIRPAGARPEAVTDSRTLVRTGELRARRDALLADGWLPSSERVRAVDRQIRDLRGAGGGPAAGETQTEYGMLVQMLAETRIAERTQKAQLGLVKKQVAEYETRLRRMPGAERERDDKARNYRILKAQYEDLLQRREQARMKADLDRVSARSTLSRIGAVHAEPSLARNERMAFLLGGVLLGLTAGGLLVVIRERADPSLRYESDARRALQVPVLGSVPETADLSFLPAPARSPQPAPAAGAGSANGIAGPVAPDAARGLDGTAESPRAVSGAGKNARGASRPKPIAPRAEAPAKPARRPAARPAPEASPQAFLADEGTGAVTLIAEPEPVAAAAEAVKPAANAAAAATPRAASNAAIASSAATAHSARPITSTSMGTFLTDPKSSWE